MFNGGPGHKTDSELKTKDFWGAVGRILRELRGFRILLILGVVAAIAGSVLSIIAPDHLSELTDKISAGMSVKRTNLEQISTKILNNPMQLSDFVIDGQTISVEDQMNFLQVASTIDKNTSVTELYKKIEELPASIQETVKPRMELDAIRNIALILAVIYLTGAAFELSESLLMTDVANKFAKIMRTRIAEKINRLPLRYFDRHQTGDILSRVTNDVDTVAQSLSQSLSTLVSELALLIGAIFMMFVTNWIMALASLGASLVGFALMAIILKNSQKYFSLRQTSLGKLNAHVEEIYSGLTVVKAYNGVKEADAKFDRQNKAVYEANLKSQFFSGLMGPIMNFIGNFGYVAVCVTGAILVAQDIISFGVIVAFIVYVRLATNPMARIAQATTNLQAAAAASERVFEFIDEPEMSDQKDLVAVLEKEKVRGEVEFSNVHFGYDEGKTIIKNFSAKVEAGQKIAIVGPTGAGKTTMVNLLMKFYEINEGDIRIDGTSIRELKRENVRALFTMVLQDTWMFGGTVRENIVYNRRGVSDEEIMKVCDVVGLSHFIRTLPRGLNTKIDENDTISAGQKQLITIARGMIEDAPLLILDEATSNVDTRTEELVQDAMDTLMEGRTSFIIAHRLSTIKNANLILVMDGGNIVEAGNHAQLMKKNGFYADLYNAQFSL